MGRASPPELFQRHADNPILTARDLPYAANTVFNAGATIVDGETILLLRVEDRRGFSHLTVARSANGTSGWRIDPEPTFPARPDTHPEEAWGIEDPRITYVEEQKRWYIAYTAYSRGGPLVSLAWTDDFKVFTRLGPVMAPEDKDAALFPTRFDGRWVLIHRPVPGQAHFGAHIWISYSPDLKHWGDHQILLRARHGGLVGREQDWPFAPTAAHRARLAHHVSRCSHDGGGLSLSLGTRACSIATIRARSFAARVSG